MANSGLIGKRGALFFTVDTMVAGLVFTLTVIVILSMIINKPVIQDTYNTVNNYKTYITDVKMDRFRNIYRYIYDDPLESDLQFPVYQKISKLYYEGKIEIAEDFINNFTNIILPAQFGIMYKLDDEVIYLRSNGREQFARTNLTSKLLTFFEANDTIVGPNITSISIWS